MVMNEFAANMQFEKEKELRSRYGDNSLNDITLEEWARRNNIVIR